MIVCDDYDYADDYDPDAELPTWVTWYPAVTLDDFGDEGTEADLERWNRMHERDVVGNPDIWYHEYEAAQHRHVYHVFARDFDEAYDRVVELLEEAWAEFWEAPAE